MTTEGGRSDWALLTPHETVCIDDYNSTFVIYTIINSNSAKNPREIPATATEFVSPALVWGGISIYLSGPFVSAAAAQWESPRREGALGSNKE